MGKNYSNSMDKRLELLYRQFAADWAILSETTANSKGANYEGRLVSFLSKYFGGAYDIRQRGAIIDPDLRCFDVFEYNGDEEHDLVAVFNRSVPKFVLEVTNRRSPFSRHEVNPSLKWIPGEAVAFVCEVKSQLDKQSLTQDLDKISKTSRLSKSLENRFGPYTSNQFTVEDPLLGLVYHRTSISEDTLEVILEENEDWDFMLLVMDDKLILSKDLPFSEYFNPRSSNFGPSHAEISFPESVSDFLFPGYEEYNHVTLSRGLFWFMVMLSVSIPSPIQVSTIDSLLALSEPPFVSSGSDLP